MHKRRASYLTFSASQHAAWRKVKTKGTAYARTRWRACYASGMSPSGANSVAQSSDSAEHRGNILAAPPAAAASPYLRPHLHRALYFLPQRRRGFGTPLCYSSLLTALHHLCRITRVGAALHCSRALATSQRCLTCTLLSACCACLHCLHSCAARAEITTHHHYRSACELDGKINAV